MKKFIRPPENWQDFEMLCKKLFGEMLGCAHTIKMNGRLGQPQSGVDIYAKPKGENFYWGIQCKGKDNYDSKQLTKGEIDEEIIKALKFKPELKIFVFATTAPKDVNVEEYIRLKDQESISQGKFEIILYSWHDLADLIEENRDTFNWYVNNMGFKEQFDVKVCFENGEKETAIKPQFKKTITKFKCVDHSLEQTSPYAKMIEGFKNRKVMPLFGSQPENKGWCSFRILIENNGNKVIEDWKFYLWFINNVREIDDDFFAPVFKMQEFLKHRTTWAYKEDNSILYKPLDKAPLIQKDTKIFTSHCLPNFEATEINLKWQLLSRDFDREGELKLLVQPKYTIETIQEVITLKEQERTVESVSDLLN